MEREINIIGMLDAETEAMEFINSTTEYIKSNNDNVTKKGTQKSTHIDVFNGPTPYFDISGNTNEIKTGIKDNMENNSRVNHPDYYNLKNGPCLIIDGKKYNIECIDVIRDMPTWKGNVIKYLWRCGEKHEEGLSDKDKELEDMKKALWYLQDKINEMEKSVL